MLVPFFGPKWKWKLETLTLNVGCRTFFGFKMEMEMCFGGQMLCYVFGSKNGNGNCKTLTLKVGCRTLFLIRNENGNPLQWLDAAFYFCIKMEIENINFDEWFRTLFFGPKQKWKCTLASIKVSHRRELLRFLSKIIYIQKRLRAPLLTRLIVQSLSSLYSSSNIFCEINRHWELGKKKISTV